MNAFFLSLYWDLFFFLDLIHGKCKFWGFHQKNLTVFLVCPSGQTLKVSPYSKASYLEPFGKLITHNYPMNPKITLDESPHLGVYVWTRTHFINHIYDKLKTLKVSPKILPMVMISRWLWSFLWWNLKIFNNSSLVFPFWETLKGTSY